MIDGHRVHPRRLIAEVDAPLDRSSLSRTGLKVYKELPQIDRVIIEAPEGKLLSAKEDLESLNGVGRVDFDYAARLAYTPNDPRWDDQWHMRDIKCDLAWDLSLGSSNVIVAVIDTGCNTAHNDLAANIWVNTDEIAANGIDDDTDGLIDNRNGYDFAYEDGVPNDVLGHGTACSGLVAGVGDNSIGITGVAPRAKIMALKTCVDEGYLYDSNNIQAYVWAADNGVKVFSMSYFADYDVGTAGGVAMQYAVDHGVLPVAAAGNDYQAWSYYPASYEGVLSVAATTGGTTKASFSNFGTWVDVAAPGVSLSTTTAGGNYTTSFAGTSGACPHVAGLAALLWGANPAKTRDQIRAAIEDTATNVPGEYCNYGQVNAQAAMQAVLGSPAPSRSATVRYVNPACVQVKPIARLSQVPETRIYGRGFQSPNLVQVLLNNRAVRVIRQTRDYVDVRFPQVRAAVDTLVVKVNGTTVKTMTLPSDVRTIYAGTEVSSAGGSATGSFFELLNPDGTFATSSLHNDGTMYFQSQFRKVEIGSTNSLKLLLKRLYSAAGATERVWLYDWSTFALPYGSWVQVSSLPAPTTNTAVEINVPNFSRFLDPEGSVYVYIDVTNQPGSLTLSVDQLVLAKSD